VLVCISEVVQLSDATVPTYTYPSSHEREESLGCVQTALKEVCFIVIKCFLQITTFERTPF
jgi:hypothetical protein